MDPTPSDTTGNGGGVQRSTLTLTVTITGPDAAVTSALGWRAGVIPAAQISIRRVGETETLSATSDSLGRAVFERLLPGTYAVSVFRQLGAAERALLQGSGFADVGAFGGGGFEDVTAPADSARLEVAAGRPGSLVFSELFPATPLAGTTFYRTGQYFELYNNADTTIYLDGKILARGLWYNFQSPNVPWCSEIEPWRTDTRGVWAANYVRFPGTGRQHAVPPGGTVLVAMDATDHRPYAPGMHDLTGADFEYVGPVDVDNPAVPNVEDIGPHPWVNVIGQGLFISPGHDVLFLAEAVDPAALLRETLPVPGSPTHDLFPIDAVLDIVSLVPTPEQHQTLPEVTYCTPPTNPLLERQAAALLDQALLTAIQRRVLGTHSGGRALLQRTRTSAADLYSTAPSPGSVP